MGERRSLERSDEPELPKGGAKCNAGEILAKRGFSQKQSNAENWLGSGLFYSASVYSFRSDWVARRAGEVLL